MNCSYERLVQVCTGGGLRRPGAGESRDAYATAYCHWLADNLVPLERPSSDDQCLINERTNP